jgi:hypothetical protein
MTNQLNEANELLQKMLPNITFGMKKEYISLDKSPHYNTLRTYLKGDGTDIDVLLDMLDFFSKKIFINQKKIENVERN